MGSYRNSSHDHSDENQLPSATGINLTHDGVGPIVFDSGNNSFRG